MGTLGYQKRAVLRTQLCLKVPGQVANETATLVFSVAWFCFRWQITILT